MDPDPPLGISEQYEYQETGAELSRVGIAHRKSTPMSFFGVFPLISNARVFVGLPFGLIEAVWFEVKVPNP